MFKKLFNNLTGSENGDQTSNQNFAGSFEQVTYDPETLHGTHYTEAQFDAEVESRVTKYTQNEGAMSQQDYDNWVHNVRDEVYREWNNCDTDQLIQWRHANSLKHTGMATSGFLKEEQLSDNPLLEPVHGVSLRGYAEIAMAISGGVSEEDVLKTLGLEQTIYDEVGTIWVQRMQEDTTFSVTVMYGQYFSEGIQNPALQALVDGNVTEEGQENLERLKNDPYFYHELTGARQAAYEYGLDGAQWILDNFGISLGDFQSVAMQHMTERNQNFSSEDILHFHNYQEEKQKEYAAKFAAEQGGNVADDVEF